MWCMTIERVCLFARFANEEAMMSHKCWPQMEGSAWENLIAKTWSRAWSIWVHETLDWMVAKKCSCLHLKSNGYAFVDQQNFMPRHTLKGGSCDGRPRPAAVQRYAEIGVPLLGSMRLAHKANGPIEAEKRLTRLSMQRPGHDLPISMIHVSTAWQVACKTF